MTTSYIAQDTIFVQIASYRDPELQHTLQDLFKKAKRPENIFVGICHQYDNRDGIDQHLFEIPFPNPNQLRIDEVYYKDAQGCCWARNRVQKLWRGEKWTLMIDSHMRFAEGWDEICVTSIKDLIDKNYNPVFTSYVCSYDADGRSEDYIASTRIEFDDFQTPVNNGGFRLNQTENYEVGGFASAHFCFGPAKIIEEVKYDPQLYFIGEEITLATRLWTSGYNIFVPNKVIAYHLYRDKVKPNRVISTSDDEAWVKRDKKSRTRVKHLLRIMNCRDEQMLDDLENYSLGKERALRDYERFAGVDFRKRKQRERAKQCVFEKWSESKIKSGVKELFKNS